MHYRKEIDGLRAIAVIVVMLFHGGFQFFSGGFLGVDVFFVISGFLITSLIFIERQKNSFSLKNFYERRIRRLLPALFLMMLVCIPFAILMMQPDDLQNFGQSLISTSLMSNNILLYLTSGYWDLASEFKPLLHTWSLGLEEQYYLFFPLLVLLIWRFSYLQTIYLFLTISLISLIFSFFIQAQYPEADFYLLPSRIWQLGAGSSLALLFLQLKDPFIAFNLLHRQILSFIGLVLIFAPIILFNNDVAFPNMLKLSVVIGTLLILAFADRNTFVGNILSIRYLVVIGLMSYSLYLWHQPLYVFLRIYSLSEPSQYIFLIMFFLSFPISYLSWKVEKIFRDRKKTSARLVYVSVIAAMTISVTSGFLFTQTYGFYRSYPELSSKFSLQDQPNTINPDTAFLISATEELNSNFENSNLNHKKVIIIGDSFSSDFINMGKVNNYFKNSTIIKPKYNCFNFDDIALNANELIRESDFIIITYRFLKEGPQRNCLESKIRLLLSLNKKFIVIGPKDFGYNINAPLRRKIYSFEAKPSKKIVKFNNYMTSLVPSENYIDLIKLLGTNEGTIPLFTPEEKLISYDRAHLTFNGAIFVGGKLFADPKLSILF